MRQWPCILGFLGLFVVGGCAASPPPPPPPPPAAPAPPPPLPAAVPKAPELPPLSKKPYESKGRRDPFRSLAPIERTPGAIVEDGLTLSVKLVGIVQGRQGLMALVETPDGLGYILRAGDLLGGGTVLEVGSDSVAFSVTRRAGEAPSRVVLRLKAE